MTTLATASPQHGVVSWPRAADAAIVAPYRYPMLHAFLTGPFLPLLVATQGGSGSSGSILVPFGIKTFGGYGGSPSGETTGATFSGAHGAKFAVDNVNQIVPVGAYRSAWTAPPLGGPYTITSNVTGLQYNITIHAGMTAREKTVSPTQADFSQGFGTPLNQITGYTGDQGNGVTAASGNVVRGDTIWMRDGTFNPLSLGWSARFPVAGSYTGAGQIVVRSYTVDSTNDAFGWPNRAHGFKIGRWGHNDQAGGGIQCLTYQDIDFFNQVVGAGGGTAGMLNFNTGFSFTSGVEVRNCGFHQPSSFSDLDIANSCSGVNTLMPGCVVDNCSMRYVRGAMVGAPGMNGTTITNNFWYYIRDNDYLQLGQNSYNNTITDNFGFNAAPVTGVHIDTTQCTGLVDGSTTHPFGTYARNIIVGGGTTGDTQGLFLSDNVDPSRWAGIDCRNNILVGDQVQRIALNNINDCSAQWNTAIGSEGATFKPSLIACGNGTNATFTRNLGNSIAMTSGGLPQLGVLTLVPAAIGGKIMPQTNAAMAADFPNWQDPSTIADYSRANIIRIFTPSNAAFTSAIRLNFCGALDDTGAWNATP